MVFEMKKRGLLIAIIGMTFIGISSFIAVSVVPSDITSPNDLTMAAMFEEMFDEVTEEIQIIPGESVYVPYDVSSYETSLLWGIQIIDYKSGDGLAINVSNIFGDDYGKFVISEPVSFEALEIIRSDALSFEITNTGSQITNVVVMFSEDPANSNALSNPDSPVMNMVIPLLISGFLLIVGIIILIIGVIVILVDLKNNLDNKRNY